MHFLFQNFLPGVLSGIVCSLWILFGLQVRHRSAPGVSLVLYLSVGMLLLTPVIGYFFAGLRAALSGLIGVLSLVGHFRKPANYFPRVLIIPTSVAIVSGIFLDYLQLPW